MSSATIASAWLTRLRLLDPPAWALALLVALPLALGAGGAAPPWPTGLSAATALAATGLALALARHRRARAGSLGPGIQKAALATAVAMALLYLLLLSQFRFTIPSTGEGGVKGFVCTAEARLVYEGHCPSDHVEALKSAEYEAERLWEGWSVTVVRLALAGSWLLAWAALALLVAALARPPFRDLLRRAPPTAEGDGAYFFVSYAHADLQTMLPYLHALHQGGAALWFDKGLRAAAAWDESLAQRVQACRALVLFISPASMASTWVQREVQLADNLGKPVFALRIGDAALPSWLALRLSTNQVVEGPPDDVAAQFSLAFPGD